MDRRAAALHALCVGSVSSHCKKSEQQRPRGASPVEVRICFLSTFCRRHGEHACCIIPDGLPPARLHTRPYIRETLALCGSLLQVDALGVDEELAAVAPHARVQVHVFTLALIGFSAVGIDSVSVIASFQVLGLGRRRLRNIPSTQQNPG